MSRKFASHTFEMSKLFELANLEITNYYELQVLSIEDNTITMIHSHAQANNQTGHTCCFFLAHVNFQVS